VARTSDRPAPGGDAPSEVVELSVPRTARCVVVGRPADAASLWYALHGYGQLAESFARACLPLTGEGRALVVPEALSRFYVKAGAGPVGASWMTRDARESEIRDYVGYLDAVHARIPGSGLGRPTHVLGFSQGAATACRWVVLGAVRPGRLVLWGGGVPPDLDADAARDRLRGVDLVLVNGRSDASLAEGSVERDVELLAGYGCTARAIWFEGGHRLDETVLRDLAR
jgi:predicted esterase